MARKRTSVQLLGLESGVDLDEVLVRLWDAGFDYITGPSDFLRRGDVSRARRVIGMATRREMASPGYWRDVFHMTELQFDQLLEILGIAGAGGQVQLPKKAISRLSGEAHRQGLIGIGREAPSVSTDRPTTPPLEWPTIGHVRELRWLSEEQVLEIHHALVADFREGDDPIDPPGVRSDTLLASAVYRPRTTNHGILKYPTIEMSAAALFHALVLDHPFHNGNKRTCSVPQFDEALCEA